MDNEINIVKKPDILNRYFPWSYGIETLSTSQLHLSNVSFYNDPFEFFPATKYSEALSNMTVEELRLYINNELSEYAGQISGTDLSTIGLGTVSYASILGFLSFGTLLPIAAAITGIGALLGANRIIKKEEIEKLKKFVETYLKFIEEIKTCCFSENYDNLLMWSHYAEKHEGMAIAFKSSVLYWKNEIFRKVTYSENRVEIPISESDSTEFVDKLISTKALCWEYEKEWRLIKYDGRNVTNLKIPENAIDCIYLGLRVSNENRDKILRIRDRLYPLVKVMRAYKSNNNFELQFKEM